MKRHIFYISGGLLMLFIATQWGCRKADSFLDKKVDASLNEENVFSDSARTMDFLAAIYGSLTYWVQTGSPNFPQGPWYDMTDVSSTRWPGGNNFANQVTRGAFGTHFFNHFANIWSGLYTNIRRCNIFLKDITAEHTPLSLSLTKRTRAEIRFLRAYQYFLLMKGWGGVPIVGDTVYSLSAKVAIRRSSYAECVDYVVGELDAITPQMPLHYSGRDYGRITKGACMALKAKVLLFAASPLYNGGSIVPYPGGETGYTTSDPARWQKALAAAQRVVDLGIYHLEVDNQTEPGYGFYQLFLKRINSEYILALMQTPNQNAEKANLPQSRGGNRLHYPTQELVDAFPMANGLPITDPNSGYDPDNPYDNRDPRLGYTVIYNGSLYFDTKKHKMEPVWTYEGASPDGLKPVTGNSGTHTGYYNRKMCDVQVDGRNGSALTDRCLPVIRYAEILLDLAEAANETGNTALAMQQLFKIRERAGIESGADGRYGLPTSPSQDEARQIIRQERMIELAYEGHRFWDLRRWKAGSLVDDKYMHGMEITKTGNDFTYKRIKNRKRYLEPKLYLFPIPQKEVKVDTVMVQNPGW